MEVTMDDVAGDVVPVSGCSPRTTSSSSQSLVDGLLWELYAWNALFPATAACGSLYPDDDGAQDLIESLLCDDTADLNPAAMFMSPDDVYCCSNGSDPNEKGLRLLHLLMAAAEALSGTEKSPELARVILSRLKHMVSHIDNATAVCNMERLAMHFADALQGLLDGRQAAAAASDVDVLTAFQMLQDMSPCIRFGHFTANQAILETVAGDRRVHVVDYDVAVGVQWASLMQAMTTSSPDGVPQPHLRITAVVSQGGTRRAQEAGRHLADFAASIGQPFSFGQCRLDSDGRFSPATVRTVKGEILVANCVLNNQVAAVRRPTGSAASFLAGVATLGAKVVTVVEDEDQEDVVEACGSFVVPFLDELHRYSAVWDSLEAGFPTRSPARGLVEQAILAPNIAGAVSRAYDGHGEARAGSAGEWMRSNGFRAMLLSCLNHSQARLLLGLFNDGYNMEQTSTNKIVLGWKARRFLSASVWTSPPVPVPSSPMDGDGAFQLLGMSPASGDSADRIEDYDYIDSFLVSSSLML